MRGPGAHPRPRGGAPRLREEVKRLRRGGRRGQPVRGAPGRQRRHAAGCSICWRGWPRPTPRCSITGESGTGKELVARALCSKGNRQRGALRGRQLRGDARAAAGERAVRPRQGRLHRRQGGARGAVPAGQRRHAVPRRDRRHAACTSRPSCCARCRSARCRPVGGDAEIPFDVRVDRRHQPRPRDGDRARASSARTSTSASTSSRWTCPPLRARGGDVLLLAQHFLRALRRAHRQAVRPGSPPEAAEALLAYAWPGNVRELQNCIERAVALTRFDAAAAGRSARADPQLPALARRGGRGRSLGAGADGGGGAPLHLAGAAGGGRQQDARGAGARASTARRSTASWSATAWRASPPRAELFSRTGPVPAPGAPPAGACPPAAPAPAGRDPGRAPPAGAGAPGGGRAPRPRRRAPPAR